MDLLLELTLGKLCTAVPLALAAWGARRAGRSPALVHGLWLVVLIDLVTPPLFRIPIELPAPPAVAVPAPTLPLAPQPAPVDAQVWTALDDLEPSALAAFALDAPAPPQAPPSPFPWARALLGLWLAGALATWALAAHRIRLFATLVRLSGRAPRRLEREARHVARRLGLARLPEMRLVPARLAPMLWSSGGRARLLIPEELFERLGARERRALLAHELAHYKRRDHLVRWLELLVRGLHWWNPLARLGVRGLREAEEACCDAWVLWAMPGAGRAYAGALLETADFLCGDAAIPPTGAGAISRARELERRLTMILTPVHDKSMSRRAKLSLAALGCAVLPFLPAFSQSAVQDTSPESVDVLQQRIAELDARRADVEATIAAIQAEQEQYKPAHSKAKELQRAAERLKVDYSRLNTEYQDYTDQLSALRWLQNGQLPNRFDPRVDPEGDARRRALEAGAKALMQQGDLEHAKVLLDMAQESKDRAKSAQAQLQAASRYANVAEQKKRHDLELKMKQFLQAQKHAQGSGLGGSTDLLRTGGRDDERFDSLEQRVDHLTEMVERLARSLERRGTQSVGGGSGGR